jgi:hypothetical protein
LGVHALSTSINTQYSTNNTEIKQLYVVSSTSKLTFTTPISTTQTNLPPTVIVDGKRLIFEIEPSIQDGRTLVPLRAIFEALVSNVNWEEKTKFHRFHFRKPNTYIKLS